ncbi:hypothetical protein GH714_035433 [Hevea brasiliensis]|uniref:P-type Ca(2+) transporter n=1 Tax=Hevea brasiliensis TaxID=3981 RepID=A0A6A6KN47_HEVBR|nr:hypothetical protein GH714_035433 [Hevea brasiliensis]
MDMWKAKAINNNNSEDILGLEISESVLSFLLQVIFQNTGCEISKDEAGQITIFGTPTEKALLEFGLLLGGDFDAQRKEFQILKVEPFSSVRKKMSVLVAFPEGRLQASCKGGSEIVLKMCDKVVDDSGKVANLSEEQKRNISDVINGFASEALRTLCLAFKDLDDTSEESSIPDFGYTLVAIVGIKDPLSWKQVMARSSPVDKHTLVTNLRNMFGEVVAVTGDGTNDAPALRKADIGLAMGKSGTEVARENADVIIMDDNFTTIVNVAKRGRAVYRNIQKFVQFQLTVNVVALVINFVSACISGSAPLTAVQLLWVNMIMDTLGALALATEPPVDELMKRPPVGRGESFITRAMWRNIFGQSIYQLVVLAVLNFDGKHLLGLSGSDATKIVNTLIFNSFVFCQVFNEINSRDVEKINVFRGMFNSSVFVVVIVSTVTFQVIIVEFLGTFAGTVPISWQLWLLSVLIGAVSMPVAVVLKCIPVQMGTAKHHDGYDALPSGPELA